MSKVLITGGSGLIGSRLTTHLMELGHEVVHLSRTPQSNGLIKTFVWDLEKEEIDANAFAGIDTIFHLAGAGIVDEKWTDERKQVIIDSRVKSADLLRKGCETAGVKLKHYISASAIGWYPLIIDDRIYDETEPAGQGFLAEVCSKWEASAEQFNDIATHVAKLRIGLVMTKEKGALAQIARPIRLFVGAGLGTGKQFVSWIHIQDLIGMFTHAMEQNLDGVYNAVGPEATNNNDFMQILADVIERPILLPNIPEPVIRILFGASSELVLKGVRLTPKKMMDSGFTFDYPTLTSALFNLYNPSISTTN